MPLVAFGPFQPSDFRHKQGRANSRASARRFRLYALELLHRPCAAHRDGERHRSAAWEGGPPLRGIDGRRPRSLTSRSHDVPKSGRIQGLQPTQSEVHFRNSQVPLPRRFRRLNRGREGVPDAVGIIRARSITRRHCQGWTRPGDSKSQVFEGFDSDIVTFAIPVVEPIAPVDRELKKLAAPQPADSGEASTTPSISSLRSRPPRRQGSRPPQRQAHRTDGDSLSKGVRDDSTSEHPEDQAECSETSSSSL